ncbi:NTP transferase domain-containing protein, partial [Alphaproteobacteria bacterium]|nr:NTP transferase domain-containing protein [Alphaproteobacteria bacterium]
MVISGLIQARMGSERLPGKVMLEIEGKPLIGHIFDRLKKVKSLKSLILATTKDKKNDILEKYARKNNILVYRHEYENDILGRIYGAFNKVRADALLKINADCPLIDVKLLQEGVNVFTESKAGYDLVTNKISKTFPEGYSYEIVSYNTIKWCQKNITNPKERELVILW